MTRSSKRKAAAAAPAPAPKRQTRGGKKKEAKGENVHVVVRIRPLSDDERASGAEEVMPIGDITEYESEWLAKLKVELKGSIEKGINFVN